MNRTVKSFPSPSDLKENVQHGDTLFPLKRYIVNFHSLSPILNIHWHPEMEFTKITKGCAAYSIDFQDYEVSEGDFICIQPNLLHSARIASNENMTSDSFVFHLNLLGSSSADICTLRYFTPIMDGTLKFPQIIPKSDALHPEIEHIFCALSRCYEQASPGYELETKSLLFHLLQCLITHEDTRRTNAGDPHSERLKAVFNYIHTHYAEELNVDDAARLCCITPSHFMHYFKEKSGITFNQYLNQYRLSQAALLLQQGTDISETAYACGFNNLPYFYKRFREYYHMTPREFQISQIGAGSI